MSFLNTLLENLKLCPKIQFSGKMTKLSIWIFALKISELLRLLNIDFLSYFEFSRQKLSKFKFLARKFNLFRQFLHLKILRNHDFLAKKFKFRILNFSENCEVLTVWPQCVILLTHWQGHSIIHQLKSCTFS